MKIILVSDPFFINSRIHSGLPNVLKAYSVFMATLLLFASMSEVHSTLPLRSSGAK